MIRLPSSSEARGPVARRGCAKWVYEIAQKRSDAEFELVDIKDFNLPLLDEPVSPILGQYSSHTRKHGRRRLRLSTVMSSSRPSTTMASRARSRTRSISCSLSGTRRRRASQLMRRRRGARSRVATPGVAEVQIATVRNQVLLSMFTAFESFSVSSRLPTREVCHVMLDQVIAWGGAFKTLREKRA